MTFREATVEDLDAVFSVFVDTIRSTCSKDYNPQQIEAWTASVNDRERWEDKIRDQYFILVEDQGRVVSFGSLEDRDYIDCMYVHPAYLGQGIARKVFENLKVKALGQGARSMSSDVSKTARPFFEKMGFEVVRENHFDLRGVAISNYKMERSLL